MISGYAGVEVIVESKPITIVAVLIHGYLTKVIVEVEGDKGRNSFVGSRLNTKTGISELIGFYLRDNHSQINAIDVDIGG